MQRLRTELSGTEQQLRLQNQQTKAQVADQLDATVQQVRCVCELIDMLHYISLSRVGGCSRWKGARGA